LVVRQLVAAKRDVQVPVAQRRDWERGEPDRLESHVIVPDSPLSEGPQAQHRLVQEGSHTIDPGGLRQFLTEDLRLLTLPLDNELVNPGATGARVADQLGESAVVT